MTFDTSDLTSSLQEALRDHAMLVVLHMAAWTPIRTDRDLSNDVGTARDALASAFTVRKSLFPSDDQSFTMVETVQRSFRRYHYAKTLPFGGTGTLRDRGPRLLSTALFMEYTQTLVQSRAAMFEAVGKAEATYTQAVERARTSLGSAFKERDYPEASMLRRLFAIEADFIPVPNGAAFRGLPGDVLSQLATLTERKLEMKAKEAAANLTAQIVEFAKHFAERMQKLDDSIDDETVRKAPVHTSLFETAKDLLGMIDAYGSMTGDDPRLHAARTLLYDVSMQDKASVEHTGNRRSLMDQAKDVFASFGE